MNIFKFLIKIDFDKNILNLLMNKPNWHYWNLFEEFCVWICFIIFYSNPGNLFSDYRQCQCFRGVECRVIWRWSWTSCQGLQWPSVSTTTWLMTSLCPIVKRVGEEINWLESSLGLATWMFASLCWTFSKACQMASTGYWLLKYGRLKNASCAPSLWGFRDT